MTIWVNLFEAGRIASAKAVTQQEATLASILVVKRAGSGLGPLGTVIGSAICSVNLGKSFHSFL